MNREIFLEHIQQKGLITRNTPGDISKLQKDLNLFTDITSSQKIEGFVKRYGNIAFYRTETYSNDKLFVVISPSFGLDCIKNKNGQKKQICVAYISNASGIIQNIFMCEDGIFYALPDEICWDNEENMLEYLLTAEFDYHAEIEDRTYAILSKSGWYANRKIDVSDVVKEYKKQMKINLTDQQIAFFEEFGGLKGYDSDGELYEIFSDGSQIGCNNISVSMEDDINVALAGCTGNRNVNFYISSDGRIFMNGMQRGRTILEGLQRILLGK